MILELLFNLITSVINLIPFELPSLPDKFMSVLSLLLTSIIDSLKIVALFIDLQFWLSCAVAMTIVYNIKHIWNLVVYCLNLIPSVNIPFWK